MTKTLDGLKEQRGKGILFCGRKASRALGWKPPADAHCGTAGHTVISGFVISVQTLSRNPETLMMLLNTLLPSLTLVKPKLPTIDGINHSQKRQWKQQHGPFLHLPLNPDQCNPFTELNQKKMIKGVWHWLPSSTFVT